MSPVACNITRMPTRAEMKARRSREKHVERVAAASTPHQAVAMAYDRVRAIMARGDAELDGVVAAKVVEALMRIGDEADSAFAGRRRAYVS